MGPSTYLTPKDFVFKPRLVKKKKSGIPQQLNKHLGDHYRDNKLYYVFDFDKRIKAFLSTTLTCDLYRV